jgi:hypothetical protein
MNYFPLLAVILLGWLSALSAGGVRNDTLLLASCIMLFFLIIEIIGRRPTVKLGSDHVFVRNIIRTNIIEISTIDGWRLHTMRLGKARIPALVVRGNKHPVAMLALITHTLDDAKTLIGADSNGPGSAQFDD